MHPRSIFIFGLAAVRLAFGTPIPKLHSSSGNITAYSNTHIVSIESHLSKRAEEKEKEHIVEFECSEGFILRGGSNFGDTCVGIHLKLEKSD
ncbi:hypothetical protein EAE96_005851 [Botrytis aclada]|nr:hypothetical protein EAE96_005851 [Botrytis aclada]